MSAVVASKYSLLFSDTAPRSTWRPQIESWLKKNHPNHLKDISSTINDIDLDDVPNKFQFLEGHWSVAYYKNIMKEKNHNNNNNHVRGQQDTSDNNERTPVSDELSSADDDDTGSSATTTSPPYFLLSSTTPPSPSVPLSKHSLATMNRKFPVNYQTPPSPPSSPQDRQQPPQSPANKVVHHHVNHAHSHKRRCISCGSDQSPCWRPSWSTSAGQLCNSCGLRYKKTNARCLSKACGRIPAKGEWLTMKNLAAQDPATGELKFKCLYCNGQVEVQDHKSWEMTMISRYFDDAFNDVMKTVWICLF